MQIDTYNTHNKRVCISVPIGYGSPFLRAALGSLIGQSHNLEIAILDASNDPAVATEIALSGIETIYHRSAPDDGQADAIGEGWDNSTAPILGWLNADDMLTSGCIETVIKAFETHPDVDLVYGHSTICNQNGDILGLHSAVRPTSDILNRDNFISQPSCFIRRTALEKIGGIDKSLHYTMDWDLWLRLYNQGHKFLFLEEIFSNVSWVEDTKTSQVSFKRYKEFANILKRSVGPLTVLKGVIASIRQTRSVYRDQSRWHQNLPTLYDGHNSVELPIVNATRLPQSSLICVFDGSTENVAVEAVGATISRTDHIITLTFENKIEPGQCAFLTLKPRNKSASCGLIKTRWAVKA